MKAAVRTAPSADAANATRSWWYQTTPHLAALGHRYVVVVGNVLGVVVKVQRQSWLPARMRQSVSGGTYVGMCVGTTIHMLLAGFAGRLGRCGSRMGRGRTIA